MNPKPLWRVAVSTSAECEEAVSDLFAEVCGPGVTSYTDLETGQTTVTAYFDTKPANFATMRRRLKAGLTRLAGRGLHLCLERRRPRPRSAGAIENDGQRREDAPKAAADCRTPRPSEASRAEAIACVLECGCPLPLSVFPRFHAHQFKKYLRAAVSLSKVRREDWAESWKRHFAPLEIRSRLLIRPSWSRRLPKKGQAVVVLDPGLSFGTGQHPTTAFCLEQLVARRRPGRAQSLLDVGTGSGILAIAAAKLGYAPVDALDIEPDAVLTARRNARLNRVAGRIRFRRQDFRQAAARGVRTYSVVCANLVSNMLVEEREKLRARVEPGGLLVLAGILASEFALVQKAYAAAGCKLVASRKENEWRSGAFEVVEGR